jgi:hypothetical protein
LHLRLCKTGATKFKDLSLKQYIKNEKGASQVKKVLGD